MAGTQKIHELVSEGRATPAQGALLIEFRRELAASRARKMQRRSSRTATILIAIGSFVLFLLGVKKSDNA